MTAEILGRCTHTPDIPQGHGWERWTVTPPHYLPKTRQHMLPTPRLAGPAFAFRHGA